MPRSHGGAGEERFAMHSNFDFALPTRLDASGDCSPVTGGGGNCTSKLADPFGWSCFSDPFVIKGMSTQTETTRKVSLCVARCSGMFYFPVSSSQTWSGVTA